MAGEKLESEVAKQLDLSVIRYSRVVEDHRVLSRGLDIQKDRDVVMCITSSGDNVLNLLLDRPKKMLAIDMSPAQNSILEIKLAAIRHLQYGDYLCLLGEREEEQSNSRIDLYQKIRPTLPKYARDFWDANQEIITAGMTNQGRLQKYFIKMQTALYEYVSEDQIDQFMSAKTVSEQNTLFQKLPLDKVKQVHLHFFNKSTLVAGRSEAQQKYVTASEEEVSQKLWERFHTVCTQLPLQDNCYLSWWFRGRRGFDPDGYPAMAPPYLTEEGFTKLKGLVDRVEVVTSSIEDYFSKAHPQINKVGLSDVFEYMSEEASAATFALLAQSLSPGGRVAFWNLFVHRVPPDSLLQSGQMTCLEDLSHQLHRMDRVFFYQNFYVVQVNHQ